MSRAQCKKAHRKRKWMDMSFTKNSKCFNWDDIQRNIMELEI